MRVGLLGLVVLLAVASAVRAEKPDAQPCSPVVVVADPLGGRLFVADATGGRVLRVRVEDGKVEPFSFEEIEPTGLATTPDGSALYVTSAASPARLLRLDLESDDLASVEANGPWPTAPVVSPDGRALWVCNRFANEVEVRDATTLALRGRIAVPREPIAAAMTPDGKHLCVGQHLPGGSADSGYVSTAVHVVDTAKRKLAASIRLPNGSTSLMDVCVSPDGRYAFATHILARYTVPTTQIERGWINTNALSIVDLEEHDLLGTVLLDDVGRGAANPWGVEVTPDGKLLVVAHAGTHELSLIEWPALIAKLEALDESEASEVENDMAFLVPFRRRVPLEGRGPRGLAILDGRVWAAEYFSESLGSFALAGDAYAKATSVPLTDAPTPVTIVRKGEMLFHDASICHQEWQSCTSCHPYARVDALNWDLLNDGFGNAKNTKSMLFAHRTPPAMATGKRGDGKTAVRAGIRHILFTKRPESDAEAIDAYLDALEPRPSPESLKPENREAIERGAAVFEKALCHTCHPGPLFTDLKPYDVGTGRGVHAKQPFDTPTLVEVWRTAPYLHDGRAAALRAVLTEHNEGDHHGKTSDLTEQELADLILYLHSL